MVQKIINIIKNLLGMAFVAMMIWIVFHIGFWVGCETTKAEQGGLNSLEQKGLISKEIYRK